MGAARTQILRAAFRALDLTGANRALAGRTRGLGVILTLHHVRPWAGKTFAPNRLLEVTPEFLDLALTTARELGFDFVTLDEAVRRVKAGVSVRPFLHLTFDDGYRDVRDNALPILRRHGAPATLYVASAFAEGRAEPWWLWLEEAIFRADRILIDLGAGEIALATRTLSQKNAAWAKIYWGLRAGSEERLRAEARRLAEKQGVDVWSFGRELCMTWEELREIAADPLVAIGAHTVNHPMLAKHPEDVARSEMADSRDAIRAELGASPDHFAYPVGDRSAAGPREYRLAEELGFDTAVTTRPGHLTKAHAGRLTSLPRVSLNGHFQTRAAVEGMLSGAPFAVMGLGGRLFGRA